MGEIGKEYVAGLFDGEGCVQIKNPLHRNTRIHVLSVSISNSYKPVLEKIQASYGGSLIASRRIGKGLTGWDLYLSARKAEFFLRDVYPYLIIKKEQVLLAFKFLEVAGIECNARTIVREELSKNMKALKRVDFPRTDFVDLDKLLDELGIERSSV